MDAEEPLRHFRKTFIFLIDFAFFALRDPFGGRSRRALLFQNQQQNIGIIYVSDALTEAMLDHPRNAKKQKNERHDAWERSGETYNERHAAWERFLHPDGPDLSLIHI